MTTPPCPRCGAPLTVYRNTQVHCTAYPCSYGHDAPRALIPQPDETPVTDESIDEFWRATLHKRINELIGERDALIAGLADVVHGPAPAPQRTDPGGVADAPEYGNLPGDIDKLLNEHATGSWTYNPCDIADGLRALGWIRLNAHPAPAPQRTDAGGVAVLFKVGDRVRVTEGERVGVTGRITGISSNGIITVNEGLVGMPQHFAHVQDPPANATSAGVDEGMRERVEKAVLGGRGDLPAYIWEAFLDHGYHKVIAGRAIAAILASHEIVRRPQ